MQKSGIFMMDKHRFRASVGPYEHRQHASTRLLVSMCSRNTIKLTAPICWLIFCLLNAACFWASPLFAQNSPTGTGGAGILAPPPHDKSLSAVRITTRRYTFPPSHPPRQEQAGWGERFCVAPRRCR